MNGVPSRSLRLAHPAAAGKRTPLATARPAPARPLQAAEGSGRRHGRDEQPPHAASPHLTMAGGARRGRRRSALPAEGGAGPLVAAQARSSLRAAKRSVTALDIGASSSSFSWRVAQLLRSPFWGAFRDYSGETCSPRRMAEDDWMCMFRISKLPAN